MEPDVVPLATVANEYDAWAVEKALIRAYAARGHEVLNVLGLAKSPEALSERQRKHQAYQRAYYQRRKAARAQQQQPGTEPAEE